MQPDSPVSQEPAPAPQEKKPGKFNIKVVLLILLVVIAAGLGVWKIQLDKALATAKQDLATLDGQYQTLVTERDAVSSELDLTSSDLQATKDEIAATNETLAGVKADAQKTNTAITATKKKMEQARAYIDFMRALFEDNLTYDEASDAVKEVKDSKLEELFAAYKDKPDYEKTWVPFVTYLLNTAMDILKK